MEQMSELPDTLKSGEKQGSAPEEGDWEVEAVPETPKIREGHCYLVKGATQKEGYELFAEQIVNGTKGLCFTREYPDKVVEKYGLKGVPIYWLCHSLGRQRINPKRLGLLVREILTFMQQNGDGVILLDGLEYLITNNDFERVMKTIHSIIEIVVQRSSILILPVNPDALNRRELALLERSMEVIE
ncbi:MAG: DUF835 domain-containing protein [Thermoplasmata archaeon]|nr:DUF835 domain-containing protein [Thermoplasmata archaeon]